MFKLTEMFKLTGSGGSSGLLVGETPAAQESKLPLPPPLSFCFQCSATCERGAQRRFLKCAEKYISGKYRELASKKCLHLPQPGLELERPCTLFPCPKHRLYAAAGPPRASWVASPWSQVRAALSSQRAGGQSPLGRWWLAGRGVSLRVYPKAPKQPPDPSLHSASWVWVWISKDGLQMLQNFPGMGAVS